MKSAIPPPWCAGLGALAAPLTALGLFTDTVGPGLLRVAFVLALIAAFGAVSGSLTETRPRASRLRREATRLRLIGLGGAGATLVLWAVSLAGQN